MKSTGKQIRGTWYVVALSGLLAYGCSQPDGNADVAETAPEITPPVTEEIQHPAATIPAGDETSEVAALVNGQPIMISEVRAIFEERIAPYRHQIPPDQLEAFWQAQLPVMLEMAIGQKLIRDQIKERGLVADGEAIDARLAEFEQDIPEGQTLEQLTGRPRDELRQAVGEMLAFEQLLDAHGLTTVEPTEEQVEAYYEENMDQFQMPDSVEARHILLTVDDDDDEETRGAKLAEITAIREQLLEGADFADLANAHSDCPSGQRGGDLGSFGRGQMVPPFETAAFSQEPGEIGSVIETAFGYHIVQVIRSEDAHQVALDDVREQIAARMLDESRQEKQSALIKKLQNEADIQHFAP